MRLIDTLTDIIPYPYSSHVYQTQKYFIKVNPTYTWTDITQIFFTILYLKYDQKIKYYPDTLKPWLEGNTEFLNNSKVDYCIRLEALATQF